MFGKTGSVETTGKDKYGRTLGRVYVAPDSESIDVNARPVAHGMKEVESGLILCQTVCRGDQAVVVTAAPGAARWPKSGFESQAVRRVACGQTVSPNGMRPCEFRRNVFSPASGSA